MSAAYYFDSGVFVTPILKNREVKIVDECLSWQRRIARREIAAVTSCLTWDEVVYVAGRAAGNYNSALAVVAGAAFLALPYLTFVPVDREIMDRAQSILDQYRLRPRDSIHASSSLIHAGGNFVSLDVDFRNKATSIGLSIHEIR